MGLSIRFAYEEVVLRLIMLVTDQAAGPTIYWVDDEEVRVVVSSKPAFEEVVAAVSPQLERVAWLLTGDSHDSQDLVQEALVGLYIAHRRSRGVEYPAALARKILVRRFVDSKRRRSSTEIPIDPAHLTEQSIAAAGLDVPLTVTLRQAIGNLPARDQAVLVLRYYCDRSVAETAGDLGISQASVRTRSSRAAARLRRALTATEHPRTNAGTAKD